MSKKNDQDFVLSKHGAKLVEEMANMTPREADTVADIAITIANNLQTITDYIENPQIGIGSNVIYFAGQLFMPIKSLKKQLVGDKLDLESYLRKLNVIVDELLEISVNNIPAMKQVSVYKHMKTITNVIVQELEAGAVLNTIFALSESNAEDEEENF